MASGAPQVHFWALVLGLHAAVADRENCRIGA
jgi:hypothetical protein